MREVGIDISGQRSKAIDEFKDERFDYVLTVCDNANESCPVLPGHTNRIHKNFSDPGAVEGLEAERLREVRNIRDELRAYFRKEFPPKNI